MLLEKPEDVKHENASGTACAIYGIDAHPTEAIVATAGGDNSIKIWSLAVSASDSDGIASFELLATLCFHQQAVNCVRWAGHGRFLASGSDDQLVLLYELQPGDPAPVPFGSNAKPNSQNWVRCSTLKRHTMDVQDVAWSPDDRMLATCSIDNTILVWDVDVNAITPVMHQPLRSLSAHNGWVKGVAWDPVGKYLASAGEDKTVRLWRIDTWQEAEVITEPFESCASTSHFRRLSWSPDGAVLCATHAFRSKKNIAALLDRSTWSNDVKFVGHQGVVTTARFNPKLLVNDAAPDKEFACCAIGGDDATVSVWLAQLARPLAVIKDCFDASVTDLTWSAGGYLLLACSLDGTICCFQFDPSEIGTPIPATRQSKLLQSKYGDRAGMTLASTLVENPIQLQLEEKTITKAPKPLKSTAPIVPTTAAAATATNVLQPRKKNAESATKKHINVLQATSKKADKKRIAPLQVVNGNGSNEGPSSSTVESKIAMDPTSDAFRNSNEARLLDARITGASVASVPPSLPSSSPSAKAIEVKKPKEYSNKRKRDQSGTKAVVAKMKEVATRPPRELQTISGADLLPAFPFRLSFTTEVEVTVSGKRMKLLIDISVHNIKGTQPDEAIELGPVFSTIKCYENGTLKWLDRVPGRIACATANALFVAIGIANGDLFVFGLSGRRLFPCLTLGDPVVVLETSLNQSPYLLVILSSGALRIWHIASSRLVLAETIEPLVVRPVNDMRLTLLRTQVTTKGQPLLTFATSKLDSGSPSTLLSYTFDPSMRTWMRIADDSFVYSDFHSSLPTDAVVVREVPMGPLCRLQNASGYGRTQRGIASALLSEMTDPLLQRNVTRSHLEHQIAATMVLQSPEEYLYWLKAYTKFLAQDEDGIRLEELCAELMGPYHAHSKEAAAQDDWTTSVLDLNKRQVLKTHVLPTIASNRSLQRLVTKYQLMLKDIQERETSETDVIQ